MRTPLKKKYTVLRLHATAKTATEKLILQNVGLFKSLTKQSRISAHLVWNTNLRRHVCKDISYLIS
jgi:hypothetical protein